MQCFIENLKKFLPEELGQNLGYILFLGGISSSVLSVFFTDKFALSQSDARISVAYNSCQ